MLLLRGSPAAVGCAGQGVSDRSLCDPLATWLPIVSQAVQRSMGMRGALESCLGEAGAAK